MTEQLVHDLIKSLKRFDDSYYNGEALISDPEYDALKESLKNLDPANEYLKNVGAAVRTGKEKLPVPLGSLDQLHNDDEIDNWVKRYELTNKRFVLTEKLDGYSCLLVYENGQLTNAFSRGNGLEGASVIRHISQFNNLPKKVPVTEKTLIRGEVILKKAIFAEKYSDAYANPRNQVSGCMNRTITESSILSDLSFIAHEYIDAKTLTKLKSLELLHKWGFEIPDYCVVPVLTSILLGHYVDLFRRNSEYEIDGLVATVDLWNEVPTLSSSGSLNPEYAIKFKTETENKETTVVDVLWEVSKNGLFKPRIQIEPVHLDGTTVTYITGNNARFIVENGLGKGAKVTVKKAGSVIPQIVNVIQPVEPLLPVGEWEWTKNDKGEQVEIKLKDPVSDSTVLFKRVLDFFTSLEVEQLKEANLEKLFDTYGFYNDSYANILSEIFDLTESEWDRVLGANGHKIFKSLDRKLSNLTYPILCGSLAFLGPGVGIRRMDNLLDQISFEQFQNASIEDIAILHGFDEKTATQIVNGRTDLLQFIDKNKEYFTFPISNEVKTDELANVNMVMTGFRDNDLKTLVESKGGKVSSSVSGKTTHLLADGKSLSEGSGKVAKAKELGVKIMTPDQFKDEFHL